MKNFLLLLGTLVLMLYLGSCSGPVQKVLSDPEKFAIVRDTVFARGLCLNDTVVTSDTVTKEHIVYHDTAITRTVIIKVPSGCRFDTTVAGTRVILADGVLTVKPRTVEKIIEKTVNKTNTVRDVARENLYFKERNDAQALAARKEQIIRNTQLKLERSESAGKVRSLQALLLLIALIIVSLLLIKKTFLS